MLTAREQFLQGLRFQGGPEVRAHIHIWYQVWEQHQAQLGWIENFSPYVTIGVDRTPIRPAGSRWTDAWGCGWYYPLESHDGICVSHPLASWSDLATYVPPDPEAHDWQQLARTVEQEKREGRVAHGSVGHGFLFLTMTYLRGFENLMLDMAEERPELDELIALVEKYWLRFIQHWVEAGVDCIGFGDDLGAQQALPISPRTWRRYIKPTYQRLLSYCRSHGVETLLHSDGYIVDIIPDLIECGVSRLNPQDLVNGLDNLARLAKGRVCLNLDIDRQSLTIFGTPAQIDQHIGDCIRTLGSPQGGLDLMWYVFPPTPPDNIRAAAEAMHRYATYWQPG